MPTSGNSGRLSSSPIPGGMASPSNASFATDGGHSNASAGRRSYTGELYGYYYSALSAIGGPSELKLIDNEPVYVQGVSYKGIETNQWTNAMVRSVSYYTYRNRFPAPLMNGADHDAGWGCMIRTGQMMMSEALRRVYGVKLPPQPLKKIKESELASLSEAGSMNATPQSSGVFTSSGTGSFNPLSQYNNPQQYGGGNGAGAQPSLTSSPSMSRQISEQQANGSVPSSAPNFLSSAAAGGGGGPLMCGLSVEQSEVFHKVAALFYDSPSAPFGIHAMTSYGATYAKVPCGEWFTPTALARTLSGIMNNSKELYSAPSRSTSSPSSSAPSAAAAANHSGSSSSSSSPQQQHQSQRFGADLKDRLAIVAAYDGVVSLEELDDHFKEGRAVLLLVPVMLGMGQLSAEYQKAFLKLLECPLSLGIVGGRPKQSLYFIGHQRDTCFYLDPHTVQPSFVTPATIGSRAGPRGNTPVSSVDPSMLLCFYFDSDLDHRMFQEFFFTELRVLTEYPLFSYQHAKKKSAAAPTANCDFEDVVDDMGFDSSDDDEGAAPLPKTSNVPPQPQRVVGGASVPSSTSSGGLATPSQRQGTAAFDDV